MNGERVSEGYPRTACNPRSLEAKANRNLERRVSQETQRVLIKFYLRVW